MLHLPGSFHGCSSLLGDPLLSSSVDVAPAEPNAGSTYFKLIKEKKVIYIRSLGDYNGESTGQTWGRLWDYIKQNKLYLIS